MWITHSCSLSEHFRYTLYNSSHHSVVNKKPDRDFFAGFLGPGDHHRFTRISTVDIRLTNNKKTTQNHIARSWITMASRFCQSKKFVSQACLELFSNTIFVFYVLLTVHTGMTMRKWPTWCTFALYNTFIIIILYMFRATLCSSSVGQIILTQHLVSVSDRPVCRLRTCTPDGHLGENTIPDAVLIQFDQLMMSTELLETCRGL